MEAGLQKDQPWLGAQEGQRGWRLSNEEWCLQWRLHKNPRSVEFRGLQAWWPHLQRGQKLLRSGSFLLSRLPHPLAVRPHFYVLYYVISRLCVLLSSVSCSSRSSNLRRRSRKPLSYSQVRQSGGWPRGLPVSELGRCCWTEPLTAGSALTLGS